HPCMCYHPAAGWLKKNGMNPAKAKAVEIANAKNFLGWTIQQPWMVLHELAHGYHDQVLGFDHEDVKSCYQAAVDSKAYAEVTDISGNKRKHYALTDEMEFFAELTESYFGTNDFFPFVRSELKEHDPRGYEMIEKYWGVKKGSRE